ncbi:MAG: POTRA domain-containing protein [Bacteroidota bacterium]|nr:POTRA domain-containing protein [Bacteroidota bacterium]MDP4243863.1 POTRA domain-containing protein [Bacteroidota bacterium]MDP4288805.1 POTRA domain-containing protein [Bacteroidota bacterium]
MKRSHCLVITALTFWALSLAVPLFGYPITKVVFRGNDRLPAARLTAAIAELPENPLKLDFTGRSELLLAAQQIEERILRLYMHEGYFHAGIDSFQVALANPADSGQGYQLIFLITEGFEYRVRSVAFTGVTLLPTSALLASMSTVAGSRLDNAVLKSDIDGILTMYEARGYPLAHVQIASVTPSFDSATRMGTLDIKLAVTEGPRARIGKIVITGNETTDPQVIVRELRLTPGSYYNSVALASSRARVERLGFFESISEPELYLTGDSTVAVVLHVKEASTSAIDGVLGYTPPRNTTESGFISGLADLSFRNISGTGRSASLTYDHRTQQSQTLEIHYLEPWLFGYPLNVQFGFLQRQQDSTFTRTEGRGDLILAFTPDIGLIGQLSIERVIPNDQPDLPFTTYDSRTITTGLSASIDTRDNGIAPRSGVSGLLGASYGLKSIYGPASTLDSATPTVAGIRTILLDASGYQAMFSSTIVGAIGLHARSVSAQGAALDAGNLFRIGGLFTIRGYREEELLASRYAYANTELRFMTGRLSFFDVFCDGGLTAKDSTNAAPAEQARYLLSYGIGAQVESPLGVLAVSIGLARGEPIDQAKFHFGLVKQF